MGVNGLWVGPAGLVSGALRHRSLGLLPGNVLKKIAPCLLSPFNFTHREVVLFVLSSIGRHCPYSRMAVVDHLVPHSCGLLDIGSC